jgi:hypothetical protein
MENLLLYIAEPNWARAHEIDSDHFCDSLSEDGELPDSIQRAILDFNAVLQACKEPLSYSPSKYRAILPGEQEAC